MNSTQWIAVAIFVFSFGLIITERVHHLKAALLGFSATLLIHLVTQEQAFSFIDYNTIGLLIGMMIFVGLIKETGIIQVAAVKAITFSGGHPWRLCVSLSLLTAFLSAFLDNVTTILIVGPIALAICETLEIEPEAFIFAEIFASNIGGAATLIGDPPNILIGSAVGLTFNDFILNMTPGVILALLVMYAVLYLFYRKDLEPSHRTEELLANFRTRSVEFDHKMAFRVSLVLLLEIIAFAFHGTLHYEAATIALSGATVALFLCPVAIEKPLAEVDLTTILFFSALFMLVGTIDHLGVITLLATKMVALVGTNVGILSSALVWGSGIVSAFVNNVPYAAAMIPLVRDVAHMANVDPTPLWWSMTLGVCLGGNGTMVGASANMIMVGLADRGGYGTTFLRFIKIGMTVTIATLITSNIYVFVRYIL